MYPCLLRLAISMVLFAFKALIVLGVECSTFVFINAGTSRRSALTPMGDSCRPSVSNANRYASRRPAVEQHKQNLRCFVKYSFIKITGYNFESCGLEEPLPLQTPDSMPAGQHSSYCWRSCLAILGLLNSHRHRC